MRPLTEITIEQYKSFSGKATLPFSTLTVLIGANASGKSNALEALRFLSWLAEGQKLSDIRYLIQQGQSVVRGDVSQLATRGKGSFSLGIKLFWEALHVSLEIGLQYRKDDDSLHICKEELKGRGYLLYEVISVSEGHNSEVKVEYNTFSRGKNKKHVICSDQLAIFKQIPTKIEPRHAKSKVVMTNIPMLIEFALLSIHFLDPAPAEMRGYANMRDKQLLPNGKNISAILYNLWQEGEESRAHLLKFIKSLPEQDISNITFIETPRSEVMVQLVETFGETEQHYDAALLSDGTLRVLAIAGMLMSAPEGSLVVIEECDNGIHPHRVRQLLQQMYDIAQRRNIRILITSHNPVLLDALPTPSIKDVVFCYRSPQDGSSKLVRLPDVADYPELMAQGSIGQLMTTGALERFVKFHPSSEEKKQKALAWLHDFKTQMANTDEQ